MPSVALAKEGSQFFRSYAWLAPMELPPSLSELWRTGRLGEPADKDKKPYPTDSTKMRRLPRRSPQGVGGQTPAMKGFTYVYTLASEADPDRFYVGLTDDLAARIAKHNSGSVPHTKQFRPWHIKTAVAFRDRKRAAEFESYLKSPSGRAFSKKRL